MKVSLFQRVIPRFLSKSGDVTPVNQEARDFIAHMHSVAAPYIARRTVGIYGVDFWRRPRLIGTGVPLLLAGRAFVATAAHVLDVSLKNKRGVYLGPGVLGEKLIDLDGCQVNKSRMPESNSRYEDPFDICLITLTDHAASEIGTGIDYVTPRDIEYHEPRQKGAYYFLNGYLTNNLKINIFTRKLKISSLPYGTILYEQDRGTWPIPTGGDYIDLDFDPQKSVDDSGRSVRTPNPKGISGCGIWRICPAGVRRETRTTSDSRLVAIEHRWHPTLHVLRGTLFPYVNQLLATNHPDVFRSLYTEWLDQSRAGP